MGDVALDLWAEQAKQIQAFSPSGALFRCFR